MQIDSVTMRVSPTLHSKFHRFILAVAAAIVFLITGSVVIRAQGAIGSAPDSTITGRPVGSYQLDDFASIYPYNGNLDFSLLLSKLAGRGNVELPLILPIERKWYMQSQPAQDDGVTEIDPAWGTVFVYPSDYTNPDISRSLYFFRGRISAVSTSKTTSIVFTDGQGTKHVLVDKLTDSNPRYLPEIPFPLPNVGKIFVSTDRSSLTFVSDNDIYNSIWAIGEAEEPANGYLLMPDGTRFRVDNGYISSIRDRNGNLTTITYGTFSGPPYLGVTRIKDSLSREVTFEYGVADVEPYGLCDKITFNGFGGSVRTIRISHRNLSSPGVLRAGYTIKTKRQLFPEPELGLHNPYGELSRIYDPTVVSAVWLPNGKSYRFQYNSHAELARVELPSGGVHEYDWSGGMANGSASGAHRSGLRVRDVYGDPGMIYRRVVERRIYPDGVTLATKNTYSKPDFFATGSGVGGGDIASVGYVDISNWDSSNSLQSRERHYYYGCAVYNPLPSWKEGLEHKIEYFGNDGATVLKRITHNWTQSPPAWFNPNPPHYDFEPKRNPCITETVTTLVDTNQVAKQTFAYDQYHNLTDVQVYDYGIGAPGPLLRHTHTDFLTTNPFQGDENYAANLNIHIRNLPKYTSVAGGNGVEISKTWFDYDAYGINGLPALQNCPGIVQHDGGFQSGYGLRGNLVKITRLATSAPTYAYQHFFYDIAGNVVQMLDGSGIPTTIEFSDRFGSVDNEATSNAGAPELAGGLSYAFPTKVTNILGHTTYTQYDFYLGRPVNMQDPNGVVNSVAYNDALDRPTQSIQARFVVGGGVPAVRRQTTFAYDDANRVITMTSDRDAFNDNILISKSYHDGLGRKWRGAAYEGSAWTITDMRFDALGRVSQVSNPYHAADPGSASPPSGLWTTTEYDAVDRVVKVTTPDGAHFDKSYNGNQVAVTDQVGKRRRREYDALGRLIEVIEDLGVLNYETTYLYDPLGNLLYVGQGAQGRWFSYDSLSRLIRAKNPEQSGNPNLPPYIDPFTGGSGWAIAYSYDANGNLVSKTDARNITTTYGYDALNRNTTVSYSDSTPRITYTYDTATLGKGRLQKTEIAGSRGSRVTTNDYDALGRPLSQSQQFFYLGAWGTSYTTRQTYDLAGNVKALTYPSDHTVNYSHNQAGRLSSFSGNLGGSPSTYADTIGYNAAGQMIKERFGANTSLYHNLHYNNRLQLVDNRLGDSATDEWNRSRGAISFLYGTTAVANGDVFANDTDNNGNLRRQSSFVPLAGGGYVISQQQDYYYDPLNRIAAVREQQWSENGWWVDSASQAFSYDRWGNLTLDLSGGGSGGGAGGQEVVWVDDAVPAGAFQSAGYSGTIISLRSFHGYYMRANNGGGSEVKADITWIGPHSQFTLIDLNGGALESGDQIQFVANDRIHYLWAMDGGAAPGTPPGGRISAVSTQGSTWETFTIRKADGTSGPIGNDTQVSLQSYGGYYVGAEIGTGEMYANRPSPSTWETFTLVIPGPTVSLRSFHGYHMRANNGGGSEVKADVAHIASHEQFTLVDLNGGALESGDQIQFVANDRIHYLWAMDGGAPPGTPPGGRISAVSTQGSTWETFTIRKADGTSGPIGNNTQVSLQSYGGYYVGAEIGTGEMYANRPSPSTWETFTFLINGWTSTSTGEGWTWAASSPSPYSGSVSHQSVIAAGTHQHYFIGATQTLQVNTGDRLYAYVYLDPANLPNTVMLQWNDGGGWEHRAYWGANNIGLGFDGTVSKRYMGPLPPAGQWVRLDVPASAVGLEGKTLNGMAFTLYGGRAYWDKAGKVGLLYGAGPPINNRVYTVDAATNRLTTVNGAPISYDAAGNQINDGSGERIYDGENRLVEAKNSSGVVVGRYVYDAEGRRVRRIIGLQEIWQVYGIGGELLAEYAAGGASNSPQKEYGYRNGQMLVVWDGSETGDRQLQWLVQDHLGSTRMVVDRSGSLAGVRRHDFAPFGEELSAGVGIRSSSIGYIDDSVRQKYTGYERDGETTLDYAQARYYASAQGRFTSVDPINITANRLIDPQGINLYSYARNNPLSYVDPTGMDPSGGQTEDEEQQEARKRAATTPAPTKKQIEEGISNIPSENRLEFYLPSGDQKKDLAEVFTVEYQNTYQSERDSAVRDEHGNLVPQKVVETASDEIKAGTTGVETRVGGQTQLESSVRPSAAAERTGSAIDAGANFAQNHVGTSIRVGTWVPVRDPRGGHNFVVRPAGTRTIHPETAESIVRTVRERAQDQARRAVEISRRSMR